MPTLAKKWFKETGDIPLEIADSLVTAGLGQAATQTLASLGWDGKLVAGAGIELTPDNRHITRSEFFLRDLPTKDTLELQANNLWQAATPDVKISITIPDGAVFKFASGTLASDYVAAEDIRHNFSKNGSAIVPTEWAAHGIGEIALRAVCHLDKNSNVKGPHIKVTFLLFPRSVGALSDLSDATQNPAWPGLRILETTCEFFPKNPLWRDPCCPLLILGGNVTAAPNLPPGNEIRFHIAELFRSARRPTVCTKLKALTRQWDRALESVEEMELEPTIVWPEVQRPNPTTGECILLTIKPCYTYLN
jgi:hypothetical protein